MLGVVHLQTFPELALSLDMISVQVISCHCIIFTKWHPMWWMPTCTCLLSSTYEDIRTIHVRSMSWRGNSSKIRMIRCGQTVGWLHAGAGPINWKIVSAGLLVLTRTTQLWFLLGIISLNMKILPANNNQQPELFKLPSAKCRGNNRLANQQTTPNNPSTTKHTAKYNGHLGLIISLFANYTCLYK